MDQFRSLHLQKNLGEVLASAEVDPVVLLNRGQPRVVLMSVNEYRRLKGLANEPVPQAAMPRRALVVRRQADDPLGYDTADIAACGREMSAAALSGRNLVPVREELDRVRRRLPSRERLAPAESGVAG